MTDRSDTWDGGYKRKNSRGKKVYVIYKRVRGKLYEVSTRCTSSDAATAQWHRFQANPENFKPEGEKPRGALLLGEALGGEFLRWSREQKRNTVKWVHDQQRALAWWEERVGAVDLRKLTTARVAAELEAVTEGRKQLIATLKTFYSWLRKVRHLITTAEDPLFGQISVPQARVQQLTKVKAIDLAEYKSAMAALKGWPRDALEVLAGTGWHVTELQRFAAGGEIGTHPHDVKAVVLLCPHTKGGGPLRTQVSAEVGRAAARLQTHGELNYFHLREELRAVGATFNPGYLRHSVATWAINAGADPGAVAAFLNHRSKATTTKFYATHAVPMKVPTMGD